ncbi:ATP-grasp domain-containing protein [Pelagophyceae sp. CCMP2097]|nr:ATP-grasp domain-containing protein [Pelagophyceae sp. CCMP2097]
MRCLALLVLAWRAVSGLKPSAVKSFADVYEVEAKIEAAPLLEAFNEETAYIDDDAECVGIVVVLDATCSYLGQELILQLQKRGIATVSLLSEYVGLNIASSMDTEVPSELLAPRCGSEQDWFEPSRRGRTVLACLSESDCGIATAERIGAALGAKFANANDGAIRRHKWLLHEVLRSVGLPACRQRLCETEDDVATFFQEERALSAQASIIVKPARGVGSDGVRLCAGVEEAKLAFRKLHDTHRYGGGSNDAVLAQQFLQGTEYAVDSVSRNGVHKITAMWRYDKRRLGEAPFVYYSTELCDVEPRVASALRSALSAVGHLQGPAHSELIMSLETVTVVEVNARFHNANVGPLVKECCGGVTTIQAAADAVLPSDEAWDSIPVDATLSRAGKLVHLVCEVQGTLDTVDAHKFALLQALPTVSGLELYGTHSTPGAPLRRTVDIKTDAGWVHLVGDKAAVENDYQQILNIQRGMFVVLPEASGVLPEASGAVPEASGAVPEASDAAPDDGPAPDAADAPAAPAAGEAAVSPDVSLA